MCWDRRQGSKWVLRRLYKGSLMLAAFILALAWLGLHEAQAAAPTRTAAPVVVSDCTNDTQLRTALATAGPVEITFNCGPGMHTIPVTAFMEVAGDATVDGANAITLDGSGSAALIQVFASASLELHDIVLANGAFNGAHPIENFGTLTLDGVEVRGHVSNGGSGGAISNTGELHVRASTFISNSAASPADGAAIYNDSGVVVVEDGWFEGNQVTGGLGVGGAIAHVGGSMTVVDSTFRFNEALDGGAIYVGPGAALTVTASSFLSNTAGYGGGIESWGETDIDASLFEGNQANIGDGGGIWVVDGNLDITNSTVANNQATTKGGGLSCDNDNMSVISSTITGNRVGADGSTRHGGGIYSACDLDLFNSTVTGNEAPFGGGGGVYQTGVMTAAILRAVTIADNSALFGGGVYNDGLATSTLTLAAVLLVDNETGNCDGVITSAGYNLASDTNCALAQPGDQQGLATLALGPLADHGGPTWTRLPLSGNPAIDAIPVAQCLLAVDQRGVARPQNTNCDVGAVEVQDDDLLQKVYLPVTLKQLATGRSANRFG